MKFNKTHYDIVGRFEEGNKYGIISRLYVEGYTCEELPGYGFRKLGKVWTVDHIRTGFQVGITDTTREKAAQAIISRNIPAMLDAKKDMIDQAAEAKTTYFEEGYLRTFETVIYTSLNDCRVDPMGHNNPITIAKQAGCIIVKNDDGIAYLHGGSFKISGTPAMLEGVRARIAELDAHDREKAAEQAAAIQAAKDQTAKDQTETTSAEDASAAPVQEKPAEDQTADDNTDQAAETEPATMDPAADQIEDQTAETEPAAPVQVDAETTPHIYAYYLPHRPVSIGTQPRGFIDFEDLDKTETGYYSIVRYERELTPEEIADYELVPATDQTPADPEKTDAEKPETAPAENNADALAEAGQTETDQADPAADNGPETSETVQAEKPAKKREKKPEPREIMTKEEAAGLLTGPDWTTNAAMLIGFDMRNSNLIMQAALDAGLLTPEMILAYLFYYKMPAFHTFNAWKDHGYIVKRGEKAAFAAKIWKYAEKHGTMTAEEAASLNAIMTDADGGELFHAGDETTDSRYLMKTAYFFTADQVEKITRGQVDIPADCKRTMQDGREIISGNTRPIKEQLKAAGYSWDRKRAAWWRLAEDPQDQQKEATPAA